MRNEVCNVLNKEFVMSVVSNISGLTLLLRMSQTIRFHIQDTKVK